MKKFTKISLILTAVLLVAGIGCITAVVAMGGRLEDLPHTVYRNEWNEVHVYPEEDFDDLEEVHEEMEDWMEDFTLEESDTYTDVKKLELDVEEAYVTLELYDGDGIQVDIGEGDGEYQCFVEEGKLKVKNEWNDWENWKGRAKKLYQSNHIWPDDVQQESRPIIIRIPRGYQFETVEMELKASTLFADEILAKKLEIEIEAGVAEINGGDVKRFEGECKVGELSYYGAVMEHVEADCNVGSVVLHLAGEETNYNYEVEASVGTVSVGDDTYSGLGNKQRITHDGADRTMELTSNVGVVAVLFEANE